jgi:hypothetical protein
MKSIRQYVILLCIVASSASGRTVPTPASPIVSREKWTPFEWIAAFQSKQGSSSMAMESSVPAAGSRTVRTPEDWSADVVNVKDGAGGMTGAKGDTIATSAPCTTMASSRELYCPSAAFRAADVGKYFYLQGAAASRFPLLGTIVGYINSHHVTLSVPAGAATVSYGIFSPPAAPITVLTPGRGVTPGDTFRVVGGTFTMVATGSFPNTQVSSASVTAGGTGGITGSCTVKGTTGSGTRFIATGVVTNGALSDPLTISGGRYTANPTTLNAEPVTGCGLTGATLAVAMGAGSVTISTPGIYSTPPPSPLSVTTTGNGVTLQYRAYQTGGRFIYGSDDTAAVAAVLAAYTGTGKTVYFPKGSYWLATETAPMTLNNMTIKGEGLIGYDTNTNTGSNLLISNKVSQVFTGISGVNWDGLGVFYPEQDGSQASPIVFPALFEGMSFTNNNIVNARFPNVYDMIKIDAGSYGIGRVNLERNRIYCIDKCIWMLNGMADVLTISPTNYFGPGAFDNRAVIGPANLGRHTAASGEFIRIDVDGGAYKSVDGLEMTGFIIQGMRFGIREMSGRIDVSNISNVNFDAVQSVLSVEGTSSIISTSWSGGEIYSASIYDQSQNLPVFNFTSTNPMSAINISGVEVAYALGSALSDTAGALQSLNFVGNKIENFGRSTTPSFGPGDAGYGGVMIKTGAGIHNISANQFNCNYSGNSLYGSFVATEGGTGTINGNTYASCTYAVEVQGANTKFSVTGNSATRTQNYALIERTSNSSVVTTSGNSFDAEQVLHAPETPTSCGTNPAIGSGSSWQRGSVTVGTGGETSCTVAFPRGLSTAPVCVASYGFAASASDTALTLKFNSTLDGTTASYICEP